MWVKTANLIAAIALLAGVKDAAAAPVFLDCNVSSLAGFKEHVTFWFDGAVAPKTFNLNGLDYVTVSSEINPKFISLVSSASNGNQIRFFVDRFQKSAMLSFLTPQKTDTEDSPYNGTCNVSDKAPKSAF